jgi:hypothetical protein
VRLGCVAQNGAAVVPGAHAGFEAREVQSLGTREALNPRPAEIGIACEQGIVHGPEPALLGGAVRGLRRRLRPRMNLERQIAHDEAHLAGIDVEALQARPGLGLKPPTERTLVVGELKKREGRIRAPLGRLIRREPQLQRGSRMMRPGSPAAAAPPTIPTTLIARAIAAASGRRMRAVIAADDRPA